MFRWPLIAGLAALALLAASQLVIPPIVERRLEGGSPRGRHRRRLRLGVPRRPAPVRRRRADLGHRQRHRPDAARARRQRLRQARRVRPRRRQPARPPRRPVLGLEFRTHQVGWLGALSPRDPWRHHAGPDRRVRGRPAGRSRHSAARLRDAERARRPPDPPGARHGPEERGRADRGRLGRRHSQRVSDRPARRADHLGDRGAALGGCPRRPGAGRSRRELCWPTRRSDQPIVNTSISPTRAARRRADRRGP